MSHANWRLDNPPVVDVAVSRRMGLFVVGRLAARHGVRVRLRPAQAGLTALIWLPDTVAAPEVASPLGRLRRFEADDYGPAQSLSAPLQASDTGAQATMAARIPRFSSTSPSFTPAADAGQDAWPGAGPGAGSAGTGANPAAGNGWDADSGRALPVRGKSNGNGAPANGSTDVDEVAPRTPVAPAGQESSGGPGGSGPGPSRLPAFGGQVPPQALRLPPIGSQDVRGGDGPSAGGPGANAGQVTDGATDSGTVTVPPSVVQDQRLPIFDSLESDWFRRSGKSLSTARPAAGAPPAPADEAGGQAWTSPADEGWRAAQALAAPSAGDTTQAGLPRRVPRANLVPGSVGGGGGDAEADAPTRSPDVVRTRMASFQRGVREGRAATPQTEES
jgi:hypothetical protein